MRAMFDIVVALTALLVANVALRYLRRIASALEDYVYTDEEGDEGGGDEDEVAEEPAPTPPPTAATEMTADAARWN